MLTKQLLNKIEILNAETDRITKEIAYINSQLEVWRIGIEIKLVNGVCYKRIAGKFLIGWVNETSEEFSYGECNREIKILIWSSLSTLIQEIEKKVDKYLETINKGRNHEDLSGASYRS